MKDRMSLLNFKNLNNTLFHRLSNDLVKSEYPNATCVEGLGGDEGIDCFNGSSIDENNLHVFQHKFFTDTLANSGRRQIKESLEQVARLHPNVSKWTMVVAKDLTPGENRWFNGLRKSYFFELDLWDYTKLRNLLEKHYRIYYDYFPLPEHIENRMNKHLNDLQEQIVKPLLGYVHNLSISAIISLMDCGLYKDLTSNHYPQLGKFLRELIERSTGIESKSLSLRNHIRDLLLHYLMIQDIKYYEDSLDNYTMNNSIPINRFMERLWPLIEAYSYSHDKFWIDDGYPDMVRVGFSDLGQGVIYKCQPGEDYEKIRGKLQTVCGKVISNDNGELLEYDLLKGVRMQLGERISCKLDEILYTHHLPFQDIDNLECKYFKI
jgi:hypothetical protein